VVFHFFGAELIARLTKIGKKAGFYHLLWIGDWASALTQKSLAFFRFGGQRLLPIDAADGKLCRKKSPDYRKNRRSRLKTKRLLRREEYY
jgi:hypothetical protein